MLRLSKIAKRYGKSPSEIAGYKNKNIADDFDFACDILHEADDAKQRGETMKAFLSGVNIAAMLAYAGKPLTFDDDDSFQQAGDYITI